jgi:hypothetical protein
MGASNSIELKIGDIVQETLRYGEGHIVVVTELDPLQGMRLIGEEGDRFLDPTVGGSFGGHVAILGYYGGPEKIWAGLLRGYEAFDLPAPDGQELLRELQASFERGSVPYTPN